MALTERTIREAKPQAKPFYLWDREVKGFGVYVTKAGSKTFVLSYRSPDKTKHIVTLARCAELSLIEARRRAGKELVELRNGESLGPVAKRQAVKEAMTFQELWSRFVDEVASERLQLGRMSRKTLNDYRMITEKYLLPALGKLPVKTIKREHVERAAKGAAKYPVQRNRMLAVASRLFTLAETWELRQGPNPCKGISRLREVPRDRVLNQSELKALGEVLDALEGRYPFETAAIKAAAWTGARISEVLGLRWECVDLEVGRAIIEQSKTGRRVLPLAGPVKALLAGLPRIHGNEFVFPASRGNSHATYRSTCQTFGAATKQAGIPGARLHDLRRSLATHLAGQGASAFVLMQVLGHKQIGTSVRYVREAGQGLLDATEMAAAFVSGHMQEKGIDKQSAGA